MRKFQIGKTEITEKTILVCLSSDEIHLIRDALLTHQTSSIDEEEYKNCQKMRSSIGRILLDPFQS